MLPMQIFIFKDLMEARIMENEVVMLDYETSEFIPGKIQGKETSKPMTPIYYGETSLYGICEPIFTINIMPPSLSCTSLQFKNPDVE